MSQVIVKRTNNQADDELMHAGHKYLSKKKVNGKWRYYYDKDGNGNSTIGDAIDNFKNEASRKIEDVEYAARDKQLERQTQKALAKGDKVTAVKSHVRRGNNYVMRKLNTLGSGKLDNKLRQKHRKARQYLDSLFNKN